MTIVLPWKLTYPPVLCVHSDIKGEVVRRNRVVLVRGQARRPLVLVQGGEVWHLVVAYAVQDKDVGFSCGKKKYTE